MAVLVLDDEQPILNAVKRELVSEAFPLFTATNGEEALQILEKEKIKVVVSDHRLIGEKGPSFLEKVKESHPDIIRIQFTGFSDAQIAEDAINRDEVFRFIKKPWDNAILKASIRDAIERYDLAEKNRSLLASMQKQIDELSSINEQLGKTCRQHQNVLNKLHSSIRTKLADVVAIIHQIEEKAPHSKGDLFLVLLAKINSLIHLICKILDHPQVPVCK